MVVGGQVGVRELGQVVRDDATTPAVRASNSSAFTQVHQNPPVRWERMKRHEKRRKWNQEHMSAAEEQTISRGDERDARNRARVSSEVWCRGRDASTSFRSSQESEEPGSPEAPISRKETESCSKARIRQ
ncbi:hypothetical protein E4U60_002512 [Claviceps pazoutovae]|uniref:Uncharacterized protein n=1 Tax=Claviceps pazoutovae TaxID=1649127 RepID=A0A9P7SH65_9HYPO|nr:hypothetical protein E4U60_002512 [Claviceps pazoutovae]